MSNTRYSDNNAYINEEECNITIYIQLYL